MINFVHLPLRCKASVVLMLAAVFTLGAIACSFASSKQLTLSVKSKTDYVITVGKNASLSEKHAAEELSSLLRQVTGAAFAVVTPAQAGNKPQLAVGYSAAKAVSSKVSLDGLGPDGIIIKTVGRNIIMSGGKDAPRGALYAVYTFLEDYVGYRWWTASETYVPNKPSLTVKRNFNVRFVPILDRRDTYYIEAFDADWSARNKNNGFHGLDAARGGALTYAVSASHSFDIMVPAKKYFAEHPEWFSEINGKRTSEMSQLCLTNPEVLNLVIETTKKWLRENPTAAYVSITQNDWHGWCTCEKCKAIDEAEGGQSGTMIRFVNAVAEAIEPEFPNALIDTFAYQYTRKAPKIAKPRKNVVVRLCSIECDFSKPLDHKVNASFRKDIEDWAKISHTLHIWDYVTNFRHYLQAHPNLRVIGPNVRFFLRHKVKGLFEQGDYQSLGSDMAPLKTWVLSKLLWNPDLDAGKLTEEFLEGYYGPAAPYIGKYLKNIHDIAEKSNFNMNIGAESTAPYVAPDVVAKSADLMFQALAAVKFQPEYRKRVEIAQVSVLYSQILNIYSEFKNGKTIDQKALRNLLDRFTITTNRANITRVSEGGIVSDWVASMKVMLTEDPVKQTSKTVPTAQGDVTVVQLATNWKFSQDKDNVGITDKWYDAGVDDSRWTELRTDFGAGWESQGFPEYTGIGWYRQQFNLPADTAKQHLYIFFGAVDEEAWIYANGQPVFEHSRKTTGLSLDRIWMTPFMFDAAGILKQAQPNLLAIRVSNEAQMGGIWRPIYLVASDRELNLEQVQEAVKQMLSSI